MDDSRASLPCRVLVRSADGTCHVPAGATVLAIGADRWFMSGGDSTVDVPAGAVDLRVERGLEFRRLKTRIDVPESGTEQQVTLARWIDMRSRGYLSGDSHLHVDSVTVAPMLVAEDLDFGTSLTWHNGPVKARPVPAGSGATRVLGFAGHEITTSVHDGELEYGWGAAFFQNLAEPMPLASDKGRPNLDYLKHVVDHGGIVHYQGGWSREAAVDALLGSVHTIQICNNNFHLHRYQPRSRYSNLLEVEGFPIYPDTEEGMWRLNVETYYRLLNCGLKLAAGAGAGTGIKDVPVGYDRAYVRAERDATIDDFYAGWKTGRNFVTNGPMLFLSTSDGKQPGDEIMLGAEGGAVQVDVEAVADFPLDAIEIVVNGEVVTRIQPPGESDGRQIEGSAEVAITKGAWLAARVAGQDDWLTDAELAPYANGDSQQPSRLRFAHTSPIYVTVGGRGAAVEKSIEEGLQMLDRFETFAQENAGDQWREGILEATREARRRLNAKRGEVGK